MGRSGKVKLQDFEEELTTKQINFVYALASSKEFNYTAAAREAGYKSPMTAGHNLLKKKAVRGFLAKVLEDRMDRLNLTADRVLQELMCIAFFDPGEMYDEDGNLLPVTKMPEHVRRALAGVEVKIDEYDDGDRITTTAKIRHCDKEACLKLLMQHLGILQERKKVELDIGPNIWEHLSKVVEQPRIITDDVIDSYVDRQEDDDEEEL